MPVTGAKCATFAAPSQNIGPKINMLAWGMPDPLAAGELPLSDYPTAFVYYAYAADGDLLYVGLADDVTSRIASHRRAGSPWIRHTTRITWQRYASRAVAAGVEERAIGDLVPKYNIALNWRREVAAEMGLRFLPDEAAWCWLAAAVRGERTRQRRTQTSVARDARIALEDLRALERATRQRYPRHVLSALEAVLCWRVGSVESVLTGGIPDPMSESELQERTMSEARRIQALVSR